MVSRGLPQLIHGSLLCGVSVVNRLATVFCKRAVIPPLRRQAGLGDCRRGLPATRQQLIGPTGRLRGQPLEHVHQVCVGIVPIVPGALGPHQWARPVRLPKGHPDAVAVTPEQQDRGVTAASLVASWLNGLTTIPSSRWDGRAHMLPSPRASLETQGRD